MQAETAAGEAAGDVRLLLDDPRDRYALGDRIAEEVERLRTMLEGPLPTTMTDPEDFARWLDELTANAAP